VHGRLRGALDQQVEGARLGEIIRDSNIAMSELDAGVPEPAERQFAAAASQVVEHPDVVAGTIALQQKREAGSDEAGSAADQDSHA
jgi:hypothetical protein